MFRPEPDLRIKDKFERGNEVKFVFNGITINAFEGEYVLTALRASGILFTKLSITGQKRGPICFMGSCQECIVRLEGRTSLACQTKVAEGLIIETDGLKT
ncbi:MAG: (2Fe-2S)-binding protein [Paracoccaceae bacterium]|nr:(2Fe-2S)-binding protein [Paracoccaceae bacterium]